MRRRARDARGASGGDDQRIAEPPLDYPLRASSVEPLVHTAGTLDREVLLREAIRANVRASVEHLRHGSELLEGLIRNDGLVVVGAETRWKPAPWRSSTSCAEGFNELSVKCRVGPIPSLPEKGAT